MDTYGLINTTWLDKEIQELETLKKINGISLRGFRRLETLIEIKELCLKLPSAENVFIEGRDAVDWKGDDRYDFEDYITQYTKSESNETK